MFKELSARFRQKHRTIAFPDAPPTLPDRFRGCPTLDPSLCPDQCKGCGDVCPTGAIHAIAEGVQLDLGRCLFCGECEKACSNGVVRFSKDYRLAASRREDLTLTGSSLELARSLEEKSRRLFGRSLRLRQVSAGGCGACEADVNVLSTVVFDLGRFGIQFVASPRHADGILVTGPVPENMRSALLKTYEAIPAPKVVIASGACAISGGPYAGHEEVHNGVDSLLPVDLYIPGCPPHPITILDGMLRLLGRLEKDPGAPAK
jgi:Ni,Fe-hydrogenase III small subunit